ncbi:acyltransferase [Methylomonas sp. HW2-6]|uniref:acyltransferase n=1 Tax=Methylomonas sp. HW2-6 TaxID=3376687 RepID=UPI004042EF93
MKKIISLVVIFLPWFLKRRIYSWLFKYELAPSSSIGLSWIFVDKLSMADGAKIGSLNAVKGLSRLELGSFSSIGNLNWISAFPANSNSEHFKHQVGNRLPDLILGEHAAITNRHLIDCTNRVEIKRFSTFAGFRSTILTHSIDLRSCRQSSEPVSIEEYCFIGSGCILLGGTSIPAKSILAAGSTINKKMDVPCALYGGTPARFVKNLEESEFAYFRRSTGFVI